MIHRATFIYAYDSLVTSTDPVWLQGGLGTLVRLFDRVGIC